MPGMKTLARISGLTVALSICSLGSRGPVMWVALGTCAVATGVLFVASSRLGYFNSVAGVGYEADVVSLEEKRLETGCPGRDRHSEHCEGRAALRGR